MQNTITLSPAHQEFLEQTFAQNRALFGGYFMEGGESDDESESTDEGAEGADEGTGEDRPGDGESGSEDENEETEEESEEDESEDDGKKLSREDALAALSKTRRSEAAMRTRLRDIEKQLEEAVTPEQVEAIKAELSEANAAEARALIVENVALKAGLPPAFAERLKGETREELEADAKELLRLVPSSTTDPHLEGGLDPDDEEAVYDAAAAREAARRVRRGR